MEEMIRPARAIAPGRIILRELEARGWSQQDLAAIVDRPEQMISEIIQAKKQITAETARQLAKAFGTSPDFWLNLEMQYQLVQAEKGENESDIERRSKLYDLAPVNELTKRGWIRRCSTLVELEVELCRFFQIESIEKFPLAAASYRISEGREAEERAKLAWVWRVKQLVTDQPVNEYDPNIMTNLIQDLLALAREDTAIQKVSSLLRGYGIHFAIVPHLPKTYLDGAALWVNGHPVIAVSLRYDRIDAFWFTILHELAHIVNQQHNEYVDQLYDLSGQELHDEETKTNEQARKWLIPEKAMIEFIEWNHPRYSRKNILEFADQQNRHPGIVVGQLMHRGEIKYSHLREYLVKVSPLLEKWVDGVHPN